MRKQSLIFILLLLCTVLHAQKIRTITSEQENFQVMQIVSGLKRPWSVAFLPDKRFLITERGGKLLVVDAKGQKKNVSGAPGAAAIGQGGLLDVLLSPDYPKDSLVYFSYAEEESGLYGTAVGRGFLRAADSKRPFIENLQVIYRALPKSPKGLHFGSRLAFDDEGYLYVTLGERGNMSRAQDVHDPYGSVIRLNPDGSVPQDNPFASEGIRAGEGDPAIWTYGHRNAQGLAKNPFTGEMWLHEHGPKGGDEVNILKAGANYGWPKVSYGVNYDGSIITTETRAPGIADPLLYWVPSIAPSGMSFYQGDLFPNWYGNLFVGALAGKHLRRLVIEGGRVTHQEVLLKNSLGRIRDVRNGPDGGIYILTDAQNGGLYRLEPVG